MKRLTTKGFDYTSDYANSLRAEPQKIGKGAREFIRREQSEIGHATLEQTLRRLQEIEDILGDNYDLEYSKRVVQGEAGIPFEVPCSAGTICVEKGADWCHYPTVFVSLRNHNGDDIDLVAVEGDGIIPDGMDPDQFEGQTGCEGGVKAYLYGDTTSDEWTDCYHFEKEDLEYDDEEV